MGTDNEAQVQLVSHRTNAELCSVEGLVKPGSRKKRAELKPTVFCAFDFKTVCLGSYLGKERRERQGQFTSVASPRYYAIDEKRPPFNVSVHQFLVAKRSGHEINEILRCGPRHRPRCLHSEPIIFILLRSILICL